MIDPDNREKKRRTCYLFINFFISFNTLTHDACSITIILLQSVDFYSFFYIINSMTVQPYVDTICYLIKYNALKIKNFNFSYNFCFLFIYLFVIIKDKRYSNNEYLTMLEQSRD